jgi:predicted ATPase
MKRYILTGTPGSGKTSLLHELKRQGYWVVEEAATDVIAREQGLGNSEPWLQADFIESIVRVQKQRQLEASTSPDELQWYDRSPICTLALSRYLGYPASASLVEELERIERSRCDHSAQRVNGWLFLGWKVLKPAISDRFTHSL